MAVAAAEQTRLYPNPHAREEYAHSNSTIRHLGEHAVRGAESGQEGEGVQYLAWRDFITGIEENLKTDEEFRPYLDVESKQVFRVVDGKSRTARGEELESVLSRGLDKAKQEAAADPRMKTQVVRDEGDLFNLRAVDRMAPETMRAVLSMDPKDALAADPKYWQDKGYRKNIAYLQTYCKDRNGALWTGAYSIDLSDMDTWRELFSGLGVEVPRDVTPNTWIRHGIERQMTPGRAERFALDIRRRYYEKKGVAHQRHSVTGYVAEHEPFLKQMFDTYVIALGKAVYTGRKNEVIHGFAEAILQKPDDLAPEFIRSLMKVCNRNSFDDEAGRTIETALRYAAVEHLRKGLAGLVGGSKPQAVKTPETAYYADVPVEVRARAMNHMLARNIHTGVQAARSYGGCSAVSIGSRQEAASGNDPESPQEAFGGKAGEPNGADKKDWKKRTDTCVVPGCPTRPGKVEVGPCGVCMGRCQKLYDEGKDPAKGLSNRIIIGKSAMAKFVSGESEQKQTNKKYAQFKLPTAAMSMN